MSDHNAVAVIKGAREILQEDGWFGGRDSAYQGGSCLYLALCHSYDREEGQWGANFSMEPAAEAVYEAMRRQGYEPMAMVRWNDTIAQTPYQVDELLLQAQNIAAGG